MSIPVCILTVHGIGFQQPPTDGRPGYADQLHENLRAVLGDRLGDDPERLDKDGRPFGPVYVSSEFNGRPDEGLARLHRPLIAGDDKIAHVALVYSGSEPRHPPFAETAEVLTRAAANHGHYASTLGIVRLLLRDGLAALREHSGPGEVTSNLQAREPGPHHAGILSRIVHRGADAPRTPGTLAALEDDIATYVVRNDLRERVRRFVQDAILGLIETAPIERVVINAHSQGTVVCWDVLCRLPFAEWTAADRTGRAAPITDFVTAGSPIRKYVDMFAWGAQVGELTAVLPDGSLKWSNFCDPADPVGDPLNAPADWRPGQSWDAEPDADGGLLVCRLADGSFVHATVADHAVDNIRNSAGGGLQAHDYWNNRTEFITQLGALIAG